MKEIRLKIHGQVQGVSFRYYCRQKMEDLGLTGAVRNLADTTVEVIARGEEENLSKLYQWCWQGSRLAKVEKVEKESRKIAKLPS